MADYLSRFPSAAAPETSHYDETFTVATLRKTNEALYPGDQLNPRGQTVNKTQKIPTVEGVGSCVHSGENVASKKRREKLENANDRRNRKRSLEGVFACNRRSTNQKQDICIQKDICKLRNKQNTRSHFSAQHSCSLKQNHKLFKFNISNFNLPEKLDPKPSTIVNTSIQSGNVNLNVLLNRIQNQPPSSSFHSDIEVIFPEKDVPKTNTPKKLKSIISFPHQFSGLSNPLVNSEKWVYSIIPTKSKIVKKFEYPEILNLKLVDANREKDPILKILRDAIRDRNPRTKEKIAKLGQYYAQQRL